MNEIYSVRRGGFFVFKMDVMEDVYARELLDIEMESIHPLSCEQASLARAAKRTFNLYL
jgi:hypothetical protein